MKKNELTQPQRQRTSVALQGLDLSSPDDIVKDGCCSILFNLRWKDKAWRPVHPHKVKAHIGEVIDTYTIVYHHPAAGENTFVAYYKDEPETYVSITLNDIDVQPDYSVIGTFRKVSRITHFGNILIFFAETEAYYLFWRDGNYELFTIPEAPFLRALNKQLFPILPSKFTQGDGWKDYQTGVAVNPNVSMKVIWPICNMTSGQPLISTFADAKHEKASNAWHGEIAFFVAYRMVDGTILSPSMLYIIASEKDIPNATRTLSSGDYGYDNGLCLAIEQSSTGTSEAGSWIEGGMQYVIGQAEFNLPDINTDLIKEVVCFSTRINSLYDYSTKIYDQNYSFLSLAYANNNLPSQPFYLMESKNIASKFAVFNFTADNLADIESSSVYSPDANVSAGIANTFDYNNRLHLFDTYSVLPQCTDIRSLISPKTESDLRTYTSAVNVNVGTKTYMRTRKDIVDTIPAAPFPTPLIISYHDYRASRYVISKNEDETGILPLQPAVANNIAFYLPKSAPSLKFRDIVITFDDPTPALLDNYTIHEPNRIQVSASNNCFSFPFENSYAVGSSNNRIIALQSAALEMSDSKFGEFPLYIFTTEGIFAMQSGEETLYSNVIPINYDKIINPNTLAINGAIVYITEKGVHLLTNEGSAIISGPIHRRDGMPPLDFLRTCKIIHPKQYNEIVLHNERGIKAYVYNIDSKYWSTRKLMGYKINTDELINGDTILDLGDEDESKALSASILTRPIKLGNVEFKRLETIIPRMSTGDKNSMLSVDLSGSLDGTTYETLRKYDAELEAEKVNPIVLRRTPFSAKYFSLLMNLTPVGDTFSPSITHIDFEWYERFGRRMR